MKVKIGKTHCDGMSERNSKNEGYLPILLFNKGYELSCRVNFDSANRENVFAYKRSKKLPLGEGCLGYPRL